MHRQARRGRLRKGKPGRTVRSPDGKIAFTLLSRDGVLYAERESIEPSGGRRILAATFAAPAEFVRWCEGDEARFVYPLVCGRLRKTGLELLARNADSATAA